MIRLFDSVKLASTVTDKPACSGRKGRIIHDHGDNMFTAEFVDSEGRMIDLVTKPSSDFESIPASFRASSQEPQA